jgi:inhibitor of nuclear factor kappa-B kinase subunit epsilon
MMTSILSYLNQLNAFSSPLNIRVENLFLFLSNLKPTHYLFVLDMCEETKNYLWALQDILGHGATSQVYKAYNKSTGELVAAKVYQVSSNSRSPQEDEKINQNKDYRRILERELDILKAADHENIVRYIALEGVISSDALQSLDNREALLIEYCNGGSLNNVLELPENRYGLPEDDFMLVFRHLTNSLRYLHDKNTVRKKIKFAIFFLHIFYLDSSRY